MTRDLCYEVRSLTDKGANRIVDEVLTTTGLSHEEQLRKAALLGFMVAGGDNIIVLVDTDDEVVSRYVDADVIEDFDEPTDDQVFPDPWSLDARTEIQEAIKERS